MLGIAHNPSMRIVCKNVLLLRVVVLSLLGALLFAGSARASEPVVDRCP